MDFLLDLSQTALLHDWICLILLAITYIMFYFDCQTVGVRKARSVAGKFGLPIIGIHHMEAHALIAR